MAPLNLHATLTSTTTDSVAVRLSWDPPLNDGGAVIAIYLIFVNMSQRVVSTDTTTTLTLNSTGQHLIEIGAVNECGFVGGNGSVIVNVNVAGNCIATRDKWVGGGGGRQTNIHLHAW